jgi:hypothetical protein
MSANPEIRLFHQARQFARAALDIADEQDGPVVGRVRTSNDGCGFARTGISI